VAIFSFLISFVAKKLGSILQAIFGWSVTALFGRLSKRKQLAVTVALVLSIAWPIFVVGSFLPSVAAWILATLPLESWVGPTPLRVAWIGLAVFAPPIVGALVHWAAPSTRGSWLRSIVSGYPLALGFFLAFIVTAITVPIVKIASGVRGWTDEHVYVQPRNGAYDDVLRELGEACARAGIVPEIVEPPPRMMIATNILRALAKASVSPIVAETLRMVRADGVEMYLYPSDLLLRGEPKKIAKLRAMMTRTELDAKAYLVATPEGQRLQDELSRLLEVVIDHENRHFTPGGMAERRLIEIWKRMNESSLSYDDAVMLEAIARRVERRLVADRAHIVLPLDRQPDGLAKLEEGRDEEQERNEKEKRETNMAMKHQPPQQALLEAASTTDLVREALDEMKELVRIEVELAKEEGQQELEQAKKAAIGFAISLAASVLVLCVLSMALVLALGGTPLVALAVAGGFLVIGGIAGFIGYGLMPKKPLERTRMRLLGDVAQLKEHIA
jgi:hypothetical protein